MTQIGKNHSAHLCSECPLAGAHLVQGMETIEAEGKPTRSSHPIEIMARAYGLTAGEQK
jgi:glycerol-3-phosphate dehydrogenase subunit C